MIVIDSAAVVDALMYVPGTGDLRETLAAEDLHAPTLLDYEIVSVLRGLTLGGHLGSARAADMLTDFADLPIRRWDFSEELRRRAFGLRHNISAYDAAYVALAEALECPLITRDARLAKAGGHAAQIVIR